MPGGAGPCPQPCHCLGWHPGADSSSARARRGAAPRARCRDGQLSLAADPLPLQAVQAGSPIHLPSPALLAACPFSSMYLVIKTFALLMGQVKKPICSSLLSW